MASASWSHSGRILLNASRVYYLPNEPSLPPLRWMAERQRFEYFSSANSEDVELRASLGELVQACPQLYHLQSVQQQSIAASLSCYLPCEALYGVLPLGSVNSALIYVTAKEHVCSLSVGGGTHEVYAVRGLQWLNLPCVTSSMQSQRRRQRQRRRRERLPRSHHEGGGKTEHRADHKADNNADDDDETTERENGSNGKERGSSTSCKAEGTSEGDSEEEEDDDEDEVSVTDSDSEERESDADSPEEVGRLPNKTVNDYLGVLHRFCEGVNTQDGAQHAEATTDAKPTATSGLPGIVGSSGKFSYLYYSPTLDLSADPVHLLGLLTHTAHPSLALSSAAKSKSDVSESSLSNVTTHNDAAGSYTNVVLADSHKATRHGSNAAGAHNAWVDLRAASATRQLYQWNGPLLSEGFALPTMAALREEFLALQRHSRSDTSDLLEKEGAESESVVSTALPWRCVCAEEVQRDARAQHDPQAQIHRSTFHLSHSGMAGGVPALSLSSSQYQSSSSMPLYAPSFIRGLVAQAEASPTTVITLLTRICCRWAGTRYNRRGLEPGHGGVVANMSMTSLWVTPRCNSTEKRKTPEILAKQPSPFAVYTVMRGSVPRRWEQPANLSMKPTIKISPVGNAAEELTRHVRLLKLCYPHLQALLCLDTMSQSKLEEPLAEAFAVAVRRYAEGTSKATAPSTSLSVEEKDLAAATASATHAVNEDGGVTAATNPPERDPSVMLIRFDVKKEIKTHHYDKMMQRCLAELDSAAGGGNMWLDFTKGHARCLREGESESSAIETDNSGISSGVADDSSLNASLSNNGTAMRDLALKADDTAHAATPPRLSFDHVQSRLVRVNCLDCLDRTNLIQSVLLCAVLPRMMAYVDGAPCKAGPIAVGRDSDSSNTSSWVHTCLCDPAYAGASHNLRALVASQGMAISQLYAGTEPHFVPYMLNGHHHWAHKAVEGVLAQRRWYQQNFFDGGKQDGVSLITRQHNPQVFNADIESPFSRDLSGMNRQVMYGLLLSILPFFYSFAMCWSEYHYASSVFQLHFGICLCWAVYLVVLYKKLMRYRVTYTNRPLLLYTRQADWC